MRCVLAPLAIVFLLHTSTNASEAVDYVKDIQPILTARCVACHGALRQKAGLRLDSSTLLRKGGKGGPVIAPGKSGESLLMDAVLGKGRSRMPPEKDGPPLTDKQTALLRQWIDGGAVAPEQPIPEDPRKHWAFQRPQRPPLPRVPDAIWPRNGIDHFIAAEQARRGVQPQPEADRATLLRRVTLDLTGLPPTREELHAFLADAAPDAYEKVVDRLLASPRYGERWARHGMDVWRYSDWYGRRSVPDWWNSASQIWRWRDWMIRSLNQDKGYDRMVVEMLAADEVCPEDEDNLVATGYLARNWYALNPNQWMRDNVEHTGKAFLGLTFNCAHCHDHKYDPISQEEYFRFRAFFEPLDLRQDRLPGEADPGPFQKYEYSKLRPPVRVGSIRVQDEHPEAKTIMYHLGDERSPMTDRPPVIPAGPGFLGGDRMKINPVSLPSISSYPGLKPFIQQEERAKREAAVTAARTALARTPADAVATIRLAVAEADLRSLQARIDADLARYGKGPGNADVLARIASQAERTANLLVAEEKAMQAEAVLTAAKAKKDVKATAAAETQLTAAKKAAETARQALAKESATYTPLSPTYPKTSTGRRRALAEWIANRDNPLTARVAVNHLWMRHFGQPLVETVYDFGRNGKKPSHPELLDWLAVELMGQGADASWQMKPLHRLLVTSATYRLASADLRPSAANIAVDSDNRWYWGFPRRRVEAEVVRDMVLHAAGELDGLLGGLDLDPDKDAKSRRRSLYFSIYPENGGHLPVLELFDAPDPCECYRRSESLVPQQALALTNGPLLVEQSQILARKLSAGLGGDRGVEFVVAAFEQILTRRPTEGELRKCLDFLGRQETLAKAGSAGAEAGQQARASLIRVLFNHHEFVAIR